MTGLVHLTCGRKLPGQPRIIRESVRVVDPETGRSRVERKPVALEAYCAACDDRFRHEPRRIAQTTGART